VGFEVDEMCVRAHGSKGARHTIWFASVQYCKLVMDKATGKSKGFGFVEMPHAGEARAAIKGLNYRDIDGNRIRVK